ncbi:MAG: hypothetical protein ACJAYU_004713 [Bradymonadia bacterium]
MAFVEDDDVVEEVVASGTDKALSVSVHPGLSMKLVELDADISDEIADVIREEGIRVTREASALAGVV